MTLLLIVELVDIMPFCFAASEGVSMNPPLPFFFSTGSRSLHVSAVAFSAVFFLLTLPSKVACYHHLFFVLIVDRHPTHM